jgi:CheY-like chemotaxis protein
MNAITAARQYPLTRVLLVDDDRNFRELVCFVLLEGGFSVVEAEDGDRAIELLGSDVACLITDMGHPGMDGQSLLKEAKAKVPGIKTILVSTPTFAKTPNADRFLVKPIDPKELIRVCHDLLAKRDSGGL